MRRFRRFLRETSAGVMISLILSFPATLPMGHQITMTIGVTAVVALAGTQTSCGPDTLEKLNTTLNQIAHSLEAAIDTNGRLYEAGAYGMKGSPEAIQMRQRVAKAIYDSNEYLIQALEIARGLTKQTFEGGKMAILEKLSLAATGLKIGHQTMDLVLQSVATLINQAVTIAQLFNSSHVRHIMRAIPEFESHMKAFEHVRELNPRLEVFAE